jgi:hypothetical protein
VQKAIHREQDLEARIMSILPELENEASIVEFVAALEQRLDADPEAIRNAVWNLVALGELELTGAHRVVVAHT